MHCPGLILSLVAIPRLSVGLDQAVALPRDSYLQDYFRYWDCVCMRVCVCVDSLHNLSHGLVLLIVQGEFNIPYVSLLTSWPCCPQCLMPCVPCLVHSAAQP